MISTCHRSREVNRSTPQEGKIKSSKAPQSKAASDRTTPARFLRREDLTQKTRFYIAIAALNAQFFGEWGKITQLARGFNISRTFVYMLAATMVSVSEVAFDVERLTTSSDSKRLRLECILSFRLEGQCSIERISEIMKRFDMPNASVGTVSQILTQAGSMLPKTASAEDDKIKVVVFLSDEIFSKDKPILVTVDPISSAILRIELADARKAENWKRHWKRIEENGHYAAYLVCDEGKGLCAAKAEALPDVVRQSDTYHAIAHQLGLWVERLEKAAYKAIDAEYRCFEKLDSARSDSVINKRIAEYEKAEIVAEEKIELYNSFHYLYRCLIAELNIFGQDGRLRDRAEAENNLHVGLDLIESLRINKLNTEVKKVRRTLPDLLNYFDVAHGVIQKIENSMNIDHQALRALCLSWQWNKGAVKSKKAGRTQYCKENERFCLEYAEGHLQESYDDVKERVYGQLDTIVQSSALVECINSIIRPYLNGSKNQISQETLNLIMFYHNHRRYKSGKRKGKTPMEILTGKDQQEDWITLLLDHVEKKDPSFFSTL